MAKLTEAMLRHLSALDAGKRSAYPRLSLGTLNALEKRRLVVSHSVLGSIAFPHTSIMWELTEAGRALIGERE